ncbi:MAG: SDR family NAD(P)-dependent oxidoreductase [bacterium]|nr:SDR family NAD(P)-dependent oxidoreductase [bacterium]
MSEKTALVTGASSGIGWEFALRLAEQGYKVTCVARNKEKLEELVNLMGEGHRVLAADLTLPDQLETVAHDVAQNKYSLLINNAGYGLYSMFTDSPLEKQQNMLALNIDALVNLSYVFLQNAGNGDALMNISSALSRLTYPGGAVYAGSKGFVTIFTESLWYEYKDKGIFVTAFLPGLTYTNFHNVAMDGKDIKNPPIGYSAELVVGEALKVLKDRKKPSMISGPKFRYMTGFVNRLLGRKKMITIMGDRNPALKK